jgi:hypothetical protein
MPICSTTLPLAGVVRWSGAEISAACRWSNLGLVGNFDKLAGSARVVLAIDLDQ